MDEVTTNSDVPVRCRCCMVPNSAAKDLTSEYEWMGEKEVYADMLLESFNIKLERVQTAGWTICEKCITRLRDSSNFKKQVLFSEKTLLQAVSGGGDASTLEAVEAKPDVTLKLELGSDDGDNLDDFETHYLDDDEDIDESIKEVTVKFELKPSTSEVSNDEDVPLSSLSTAVKRKAPVKTVAALAAKWPKLTIKPLSSKTTVQRPKRLNPQYSLPMPIPIKTDRATVHTVQKKPITSATKVTATKVTATKLTATKLTATKLTATKVIATKLTAPKSIVRVPMKVAKIPVKTVLQRQSLSTPLKIRVKPSTEAPGKGRVVGVGNTMAPSRSKHQTLSNTSVPANQLRDRWMKANCNNILECSNIIPFKWNLSVGLHCFYCELPFTKPEELRLHTRDVHSQAIATKIVMKSRFENYVKVDINTINCKICSEHFDDMESLRKHLESVHAKKFHNEAHLGVLPFCLAENTYVCAICQKKFLTFHTLNHHVSKHFENYICDKCGEGFMTAQPYSTHLKKHAGFICVTCGANFKTESRLKDHRLDVHVPKRFQCPQCPEVFPDKLRKERHCIQVHKAKNYNCDICGGFYTTKQVLTMHKRRMHVKEIKHFCKMCDKGFFSKEQYQDHMRVHTGERPYACTYCEQTFKRKKGLSIHVRIHNNDKRCVCSECGAAFVQTSSLKWHLKSQHKYAATSKAPASKRL